MVEEWDGGAREILGGGHGGGAIWLDRAPLYKRRESFVLCITIQCTAWQWRSCH